MPSRQSRGARMLVACLAASAVLAGWTAPALADSHSASYLTPAGAGALVVSIDVLAPLQPSTGDVLSMSGTVTNVSAGPVRFLSVRLEVGSNAVRDRADIAAASSDVDQRQMIDIISSQVDLNDQLAAGQVARYRIDYPVKSLGFSSLRNSVRIVGVVAVADLVEGDGRGAEALGGARTFLPWFPVPQGLRPTGLVWLWPLTDTPARTADDSVTGARAIAAFSANGRLTRLLGLAATSPVPLEVVVDPALVETARALADGATGPAGTTSAPDPGAAAWLQDVAALTARAPYDVYPYADPDIAALHRAGSDLDLARAITSAPRRTAALLSTPPRTVLPWPQLGRLDAGALEGLGAAGATRVVLSDRTLPTDRSQTADGVGRVGGSAGLTALISDTGLDTALRITGAGRVIQRQRFLAELAQTTLDDPSAGHLLVVAPPAAWNPDPTTIRALLGVLSTSTWARAATVAELLATPGATDSPTRTLAEYTTRARSAELPQAYLRGIQAGRAELDTFRSVVADPADSRTLALEDALSRCQSSSWRSDLPGGRALLATTNAAITALNSAIRVVGSSSTTFPGETGIVPVTVANDLETPVRVGVRLSGSPAPRFESAPVAPVTIEPGAKMSLEVPARVIGSGDVLVSVQLTAPDGRDFAAPARVVVRSTAYARAASWIVGALAVLLVGLIAVNVVRRRSVGRAARESSART